MWAVMKQFNVLPTDPRFQSLTQEQLDFLILSMQRDVEEANANVNGNVLDGDFVDNEFDQIYNSDTDDWDIMHAGQDPEDIHEQIVKAMDNPDYEAHVDRVLKEKQANAVNDKQKRDSQIISQISDTFKNAQEKAKLKEKNGQIAPHKQNGVIDWGNYDDDDEFTKI